MSTRTIMLVDDGAEAYRLFKETRPDLVIMDLTMPGVGGIEAIRHIRQWDRSARILVFTMHQNAAFALQAIRAGARGYVTKTSPPEALLRAVFEVLDGGSRSARTSTMSSRSAAWARKPSPPTS